MSRRDGKRNQFEYNRNYLIPLICVIVTLVTIIVSVILIINLKKENNKLKENNNTNNELDQYLQEQEDYQITDNEKVQINQLVSFLVSNLDTSKDLNDKITRFNLVAKYYLRDNESNTIPEENINEIDPDTYRNLGYVYFDDYKEEYQYITEEQFKNTYQKLFDINEYNSNDYSIYHISSLNGYVIPKNSYEINDSKQYKLNKVQKDLKDASVIDVSLLEINLYKLYETMSLEQIDEYLNSVNIDDSTISGNRLSIKVKKQNDIYIFNGYSNI